MALHNLKKIQRIAALAITSTLRTSPNDFLDVHANILPMELALLKSCHSTTICHISLPDTNPVHQIIKNYKTNPPNIHLSPLYKLIKLFQLSNIQIETIKPATKTHTETTRFNTTIDDSRGKSIQTEAKDKADYKIFSDGSCQNNGVGAAAVLY